MRRLIPLVVIAVVLSGAAVAGATRAATPGNPTYSYGARDAAPNIALRLGQSPRGFTGGRLTASTGDTVYVYVEDALLAADPATGQRWADVLGGLLHGPELPTVALYVAGLDRVRQLCGAGALGCYGDNQIIAIGEDIRGVTAESVVMHEYGHHVAASGNNDPWPAVDWGTKRWASYLNVCRKSKSGELVPGDEDRYYELNPGEGFAEDYRVLSERRAGLPESSWDVVDQSLYPDQTALDQLAQDITSPWTGNTTTTYRSRLAAGATGRGFRVSTPYDGDFTATLTSPAKARFTLRLVDLATGSQLSSFPGAARVKSLDLVVCGERQVQVQVRRVSGAGPFQLTVSKP